MSAQLSLATQAGSGAPLDTVTLDPVAGVGAKSESHGKAVEAIAGNSFTTTYQWRGNGTIRLNLRNGSIFAGSRVFASASEYNTAWNVDRFIGNATLQVLNVAPYNGGVWVLFSNNWGSPINNCISLFVEP